MEASQILYPIMFIFSIYFIFSNYKNNLKYKKENMKPLFYLKDDDKIRHTISNLIIIFILVITLILLIGIISANNFTVETFFSMIVLPLLLVFLYIPLTKKTMVSTLGIHKRGALVRWEDIKGVNYLKPNAKDQVLVKVIYGFSRRDLTIELKFNKDDANLEKFKESVKEYRNNKKKEKKSGK